MTHLLQRYQSRLLICTAATILTSTPLFASALKHKVISANLGGSDRHVLQSDGSWTCAPNNVPLSVCPADSEARSMIFSTSKLVVEFKGLKPDAQYAVELTYLSDAAGREQAVYIDGKLARDQFILPAKNVFTQRIQITKSAILDGKVTIEVDRRAGPNAILSSASLFSDDDKLSANLKVDYYGTGKHISGSLKDLNNPKKTIGRSHTITAQSYDKKVTTKTDTNGAFSFNLPETWLQNEDRAISLSCEGVMESTRFTTADLTSEQYRKAILATNCQDPFELAVAKDGRVIFIERLGTIKMVSPRSTTAKVIGKIEVYNKLDDGLLGLALDPNFTENNWIYLCYSPVESSENVVARFTLSGDQIDLSSEKIILRIPVQRDTPPCHTGGSLAFDKNGNLFISTGDNVNPFQSSGYSPSDNRKGKDNWDAQTSSADTNDLRGKILRITPQADGSYTIPKGNLFPSRSKNSKTKPEIYVMGCRNPFRISVDQKNGTLYWGEVGPDAGGANANRGPAGHDEVNQARTAGNHGWPHFVADNKPYVQYDFATKKSGDHWDPKMPINISKSNKGLKKLPASKPAFIWYPNSKSAQFPELGSGGRCAMGGPVFYHNSELDSPNQLNKKYDHSVFFYDWMRGWIMAGKLDSNEKLVSVERFMPNTTFKRPMDLELGPEGALYLIEWGSAYGGSNANAQVVRLQKGMHLNSVKAPKLSPQEKEKVLLNKFAGALTGGDAAKGREFFQSPKAGCVYCHKTNEPGGMIGPDLEHIGSQMSKLQLLESVILPSKSIPAKYQSLAIEMVDGKKISGTLSRENKRGIELVSSDGKEHRLLKKQIKEIEKGPSPMPDGMGDTINPADMKNLIQYLAELKSDN